MFTPKVHMNGYRVSDIQLTCLSMIYVFLGKQSISTKEDWIGMIGVVMENMLETIVNRYE